MLTVDFSNAFNMVDMSTLLHEVRVRCPPISLWVEFLYGQSARLYLGDGHIMSATRVQQGDPLGFGTTPFCSRVTPSYSQDQRRLQTSSPCLVS
ncbi:hypothetical protein QL285_028392 [Trifolium repens]|nr:hypothetical protein QL285_028392 [Trifolium repens]